MNKWFETLGGWFIIGLVWMCCSIIYFTNVIDNETSWIRQQIEANELKLQLMNKECNAKNGALVQSVDNHWICFDRKNQL